MGGTETMKGLSSVLVYATCYLSTAYSVYIILIYSNHLLRVCYLTSNLQASFTNAQLSSSAVILYLKKYLFNPSYPCISYIISARSPHSLLFSRVD